MISVQLKPEILLAEEIQVGDSVWQVDPSSREPQRTTVTQITRGPAVGLFNPHTLSGSIVVNDIAALTFTDTLPKSTWVHSLVTAPGALLYWLCPTNEVAEAINSALLRVFGG